MDFDGIMLLMEQDRQRFAEWEEKSRDLSLEELKKSVGEWLSHYWEVYHKYRDLETGDRMKDTSLMMAKVGYFHYLANYALNVLGAYTFKLDEEYASQKKSRNKERRAKKTNRKFKDFNNLG